MGLVHGSHPGFPAAAAAADAVEQGERVDAFWAVYVLDKCWSVALESPSAISDSSTSGTRISTPWPLSIAQYEQGRVATYTGVPVISEFLNGHTIGNLDYFSPFALRAQASTLFSQASVLASRYRDGK
ncbi:uncharacterized protein PHACADRAFT_175699 [Phanerochaete carnosa HHB-10118-sp]|uniref:Transcription factor domain-containing protein n=1 Tax=Phanerochaete carnosa (strain HHB-10118-sp) TaxID=650164 RepID=K5UTP3_PHACS|nr:uncharacterized protein PHACADRAFT_175699 [Phanerochaete carnosa HHB-10118-sp]EKM53301.1 hypothetical protein PHACADRAFT_175699 [Phanerochaete carnosa HHB-10118-sp]